MMDEKNEAQEFLLWAARPGWVLPSILSYTSEARIDFD